ncbi:MAG: GNAT family N-acetyltransferase [Candidatus Cloacimonadota bacterium]|nr:MAG: GNAT family N-acetyltransferase [Candidatus Cloacimonadota bacterium]
MKYLETNRFYLREFTLNDVDSLYKLDFDPEVMRWLTNGVYTPKPEVKRLVLKIIDMMEKYNHLFGIWVAIANSNERLLGWFHLIPATDDVDNLKKVELGYRLFRDLWGQGYATEGSEFLIKKAFDELGVEEICQIQCVLASCRGKFFSLCLKVD